MRLTYLVFRRCLGLHYFSDTFKKKLFWQWSCYLLAHWFHWYIDKGYSYTNTSVYPIGLHRPMKSSVCAVCRLSLYIHIDNPCFTWASPYYSCHSLLVRYNMAIPLAVIMYGFNQFGLTRMDQCRDGRLRETTNLWSLIGILSSRCAQHNSTSPGSVSGFVMYTYISVFYVVYVNFVIKTWCDVINTQMCTCLIKVQLFCYWLCYNEYDKCGIGWLHVFNKSIYDIITKD